MPNVGFIVGFFKHIGGGKLRSMVSRVIGLARVGYELHHFHKIRNLFGDSMPTTRFKNMMLDFFARYLATVNFWQKTT